MKQQNLTESKKQTILGLLNEEDKLVMKKSFCYKHHDRMEKRYPSGVQNLWVTEKKCFEFIHSLNFENYFYNIAG